MKLKAYIAASGLLISVLMSAQENPEWNNSFSFAGISHDPVSAGVAFAGKASASSSAWAAFYNPAAMSLKNNRLDVQASWQNWAPDGVKSTNVAAGASFRFGKLGIAAGFARNGGEKYDVISTSGKVTDSFTPSDLQLGAGLSFAFAKWLSIGVNFNYLNTKLTSDDSFGGFGADIMANAVFDNFKVAVGVEDLGSSVKSASDETFSMPSSLVVAGDWSKRFGASGLGAMLDLNYYFSGSFTAAVGAQYDYKDMLFVRAGYHYGAKDAFLPSFATVGAGVKFFGISLNAAYLLGNDILKNTLTVGLGYSF